MAQRVIYDPELRVWHRLTEAEKALAEILEYVATQPLSKSTQQEFDTICECLRSLKNRCVVHLPSNG
jgi:hypothetical protein